MDQGSQILLLAEGDFLFELLGCECEVGDVGAIDPADLEITNPAYGEVKDLIAELGGNLFAPLGIPPSEESNARRSWSAA